MRFLLWNLNHKPLTQQVARLARHSNIDFLVLVECAVLPRTLLSMLHSVTGVPFHPIRTRVKNCCLLARFSSRAVHHVTGLPLSTRYDIHRIAVPSGEILLVTIHAPSKWTGDPEDQGLFFDRLQRAIKRTERQFGRRTLVVGDLNANPFEQAVASTRGLNAVMSRRTARSKPPKVQGKRYRFFYNPMWNLLGDQTAGPPGTYYHHTAKAFQLFWHMLDQVLVRPSLLRYFMQQELKIVDRIGSERLVAKGRVPRRRPDKSDHLPLVFELSI